MILLFDLLSPSEHTDSLGHFPRELAWGGLGDAHKLTRTSPKEKSQALPASVSPVGKS
jgi:hypothetical protein